MNEAGTISRPLSLPQYKEYLLKNLPHDGEWYYGAWGKRFRIKNGKVEMV
jgi:hypothetical protein